MSRSLNQSGTLQTIADAAALSAAVAPKLDATVAAATYATPANITTAVAPKLNTTDAAATYQPSATLDTTNATNINTPSSATATSLNATYGRRMEAARPHAWYKTYRVNPAGTNGAYTTIGAAMNAIKTDNGASYGFNRGDNHPSQRRLVLIDPGTYNEIATPPMTFVDMIGTSGNRDDVIVWLSGNTSPLDASGKTMYVANMTFYLTGNATSTGVHALNGTSGVTPTACMFENVRFKSDNTATNGPNAVNVLVNDGGGYLFYQCDFVQPSGNVQACEFGNRGNSRTRPGYIICVDCTASAPGCGISVVNFLDVPGNAMPDTYAWIGGSIDSTGLTGAGTQVNMLNFVNAQSAQLLLSTGYTLNTVSYPTVVFTAPDDKILLPDLPVGGLTDSVNAWFGYDHRTSSPTQRYTYPVTTPEAAASTLTANRVYYVPLDVRECAYVYGVSVGVVSPSGKILAGVYLDDGTGKPKGGMTRGQGTGLTTVVGQNIFTTMTYGAAVPGCIVPPGYGTVWLALVADNATATFVTSSLLSTVRNVYYQDISPFTASPSSAAPILLPPGTPCPILSLISN